MSRPVSVCGCSAWKSWPVLGSSAKQGGWRFSGPKKHPKAQVKLRGYVKEDGGMGRIGMTLGSFARWQALQLMSPARS